MKLHTVILPLGALVLATAANATPSGGEMETCMKAALAKKQGETVKLEFKQEGGKPVYEFEITGADGKTYKFECDAAEGKIVEEEEEVDGEDDPRFQAKNKIGLAKAKEIALKAHPGEIVETEYEIESNGSASYEFDIRKQDGKEIKLEVDAATGKIVEDNEEEIYQIGKE